MSDIPSLIIALAIGTGILMVCLAMAVGLIQQASRDLRGCDPRHH